MYKKITQMHSSSKFELQNPEIKTTHQEQNSWDFLKVSQMLIDAMYKKMVTKNLNFLMSCRDLGHGIARNIPFSVLFFKLSLSLCEI